MVLSEEDLQIAFDIRKCFVDFALRQTPKKVKIKEAVKDEV